MGLIDSLKDFYYRMQDRYYGFLDFLEEKGIPVYKVVDALESNNIPSFPIAIIVCLLLLAGLVYLLAGFMLPSKASLKFMVTGSEGVISGAQVKVMFEGKELTQITDNEGIAIFSVPLNTLANYEVSKSDYDNESGSRLVSSLKEEVSVRLSAAIKKITKTVLFKNKEGTELIKNSFVASFSCSNNRAYSETKNVSNGTTSIQIPSDCGNIIVETMGGMSAENPSVDSSLANIEIRLSAPEEGKGSAIAFVKDSSGEAIAGIEVYLVKISQDGVSLQNFGPKSSSALGSVSFSSIPEGSYCITTYDSQGVYAEYDSCSSGERKSISKDETAEFSIVLSKRVVGKVKLIVKDKSSLREISGAEVSLLKDGMLIKKETSNENGKVEFSVGENIPYDASVDKLGYLIETLEGITPKEDYYEVLLKEATLDNSRALRVKVIDERKEPVEDARLKLMNLEGTQVGDELLTGIDGIAVFDRLDEGTYKIYASKPGYDERYSDEIIVSGRKENSVELSLNIGRGNIEVSVYDDKEQPLPGATVRLVDFYSGENRGEKTANKDGIVNFSERADKTVYAVVSASGYASYTTLPVKMAKDINRKQKANLEKSIAKLEIKEKGIYVGDEILQKPYSLNPGQAYKVKFMLYVPENSSYDEAGIHIRTGKDESKTIDKDEIYIKEIYGAYSYNTLRKGTTYSPPTGYSSDLKSLTRSDAKWANAAIIKPSGGVYEFEAEVVVKDSAKLSSNLEIKYRAYAKSGGYIRDPYDAELGNSESVATRQSLYANTKAIVASVGPSALCNDDFCSFFMIEDMATNIRTYVVDEYSGEIQGNYKLLIGNIVKQSEGGIANAELRIEDGRKGILFGQYSIKTASGLKIAGIAESSKISLAAGNLEESYSIGGEAEGSISYVEFSPKKEGISEIKVSIVSGEGDVVFEKSIRFNVNPAREMSVNIIPKAIVPYVQNNILVEVTAEDDGTPLSDALVTVKKGGDIIANGLTDEDGIFAYSLVSPNPGSILTLQVEKTGFKTKAFEVKVSENIIEVLPTSMEVRFIIGTAHEIESEFLGRNITLIPLTIENIELSSEFSGYVTLDYDKSLIGKIVDVNSDFNATVLFSLTKDAIAIEKPKTIDGTINITLANKDLSKKWVSSIETTARIGFGDEVDNLDCLSINKPIWKIVTSTETKSTEITLSNKCSVDNEAVALSSLEARVLGKDVETGKLELFVKDGGSAKIIAGSNAQKLISSIAPGADVMLELEFTPAVSSGAENLEIEFSAKHYTEKGSESIKTKMNADIAVSRLNECIAISPTSINLDSCSVNTGYGMYGNYFGNGFGVGGTYNYYDPNAANAAAMGYHYGGSPNYSTPLSTGVPGMGYAPKDEKIAFLSDAYLQYPYDYTYGSIYGTPYYGGYYPNIYGSPYSSYGYNNPNVFPNQYYYPQIAGTGFISGIGNIYSIGCGDSSRRRITITNNCATEVEFSAMGDEGVNVAENKFTLKPGESKSLAIEPKYALGSYRLGLSARPKGSTENMQKLADVQVNVENELLKGYRDCISIDPPSTLKFNSFLGKGTYLKVMNACFNEGIRLPENNNAITFFEDVSAGYPSEPYGSGYEPYPPYGPLTSTVPNATPADLQKLIDNIAYVGSTYEARADGKVVQVLTFRIIKSVRYQQDAPKFPEREENPFQVVGGLRYFFTKGYYAVKANTMLVVNFFTRTGMQRSTYFPMTIEDWWQAMPYGERVIKFGDPTYLPEQCVPQEEGYSLDFTQEYPDCVPTNELNKVLQKKIIKMAERDDRGNEKNGCGSMDKITEIMNPVIEKNGLKFLLSIDDSGHSIKLVIRGWEQGGSWTGAHTIVDETIRLKVKRAYYHTEEKIVSVRFKICVKGRESIIEGGGAQITMCPEGQTGTGVYTKYGFDKLLFKWNEEGITKDTCDALAGNNNAENKEYKFCDAAQFGIVMNKKEEIFKKVVDDVIDSTNKKCALNGKEECDSKYMNSKELYRWAIEYVQVKDDSVDNANKWIYFFKKSNGGFVEDEKAIEEILGYVKNTSENIGGTDYDAHLKYLLSTEPALDKVNSSANKDEVLILLDKSKFGEYADNDKRWIDDIGSHYAITFNEFYAAFKKTVNEYRQGGSRYGREEAKDDDLIVNSRITITVANLNKILKSLDSVVIGIIAKENLDKESKEKVMKEGKPTVNLQGYPSLLDLYKDLVEFDSYLINDGYNQDYKEDFAKVYGENDDKTGVKFSKWAFEPVKLGSSGMFSVVNNYDWSNNARKITIETKMAKAVSQMGEYANNSLLYTPFDGSLGYEEGNTREGYGSAYSGMAEGIFYFNNSKSPTERGISVKNIDGTGFARISASYGFDDKKFAATKILNIGNNEITFMPSDPVYVKANITKSSKDGSAGIVYHIKHNGDIADTGIIKWNILKDEVSGKIGNVIDQMVTVSALCPSLGSNRLPGMIFNGSSGRIEMESIIYAPTAIRNPWISSIKIDCIKDSGEISSYDVIAEKSSQAIGIGNEMPLNDGKDGTMRVQQDYSLENLIEKIKDESKLICVKPTEQSTAFYWNPAQIRDVGKINLPAASTTKGTANETNQSGTNIQPNIQPPEDSGKPPSGQPPMNPPR